MHSQRSAPILATRPERRARLGGLLLVLWLWLACPSPGHAAAVPSPCGEAAAHAAAPARLSQSPSGPVLPALDGGPEQAGAANRDAAGFAWARSTGSAVLASRLDQWPRWQLPGPLPRPGRQPPRWPDWFAGEWQVSSETLVDDPPHTGEPQVTRWTARFVLDGQGRSLAERAFNAASLGRALLGEALLGVQDDPASPLRQLARLRGDRYLETTLVGARQETPGADCFLNDELSLQVLHGPGEPRVTRVETLGRWRRLPDGSITGEQWQARYGSPGEGLIARPETTERFRLHLLPVAPDGAMPG